MALGTTAAIDQVVLEGARKAFADHGWHGATLERIAGAAGVSRVTLHRRGISKEAILECLAERAVDEYREAMWPALVGEETADARLRQALETLCRLTEENLDLVLALNARANAAIFHEEGEEALTRGVFTEPLERLIRDGAQDGTLRTVDPRETATVLFNLVAWTYIHLRSEHGWKRERAQRATLDLALNGLAGGSPARATQGPAGG